VTKFKVIASESEAISTLLLTKSEIAAPFGLAMTTATSKF